VLAALNWTQQPSQETACSQHCRDFVQQHAGAVARSLARLSPWMTKA
jgi:hypothetical protein